MSKEIKMSIKAGDVVRLRSGGPEMTVEASVTGEEVRCVFFNAHVTGENEDGDTVVSYALNRLMVGPETLRVVLSADDEVAE